VNDRDALAREIATIIDYSFVYMDAPSPKSHPQRRRMRDEDYRSDS
jgi:hypothetical protein